MIRMEIDEATPSLNKYAFTTSWKVQYRDKQRWKMLLLVASRQVNATKATGKRRVTIERFGKRSLDIDNLYGGLKPILDGMRQLGLIMDDDSKNLELVATNCVLPKGRKPHTVITLQDASDVSP